MTGKTRTAKQASELIIAELREAGHVALLAGGCVRDELLGRTPKDYDIATDARPDRVAQLFRRTEQVGAKFGVTLVRLSGWQIEVATFRADGNYTDGRHPDGVAFGNQTDDAQRRDFTINGMFFDIERGEVIDHVGGQRDLKDGIVRAIGDPERRFAEDHLRMLRAVRFAGRLGFDIEETTLAAIRRHAHQLAIISRERVREELRMILTSPTRVDGWRWLRLSRLENHLLPGVVFSKADVLIVSARLAALPEEASMPLVLAALLAEIAPKRAEAACCALTSPTVESRAVAWLLKELPRGRAPDALELADIKILRADKRFADFCHLLRADLTASESALDACEELTRRAQAIPAEEVAPPPFIDGRDLLARNIPRGPIYAAVLQAVYRAQLNGEIRDRQSALERMEELVQSP